MTLETAQGPTEVEQWVSSHTTAELQKIIEVSNLIINNPNTDELSLYCAYHDKQIAEEAIASKEQRDK